MQPSTNSVLRQRLDQSFYDAVVKSAGLTITFDQVKEFLTIATPYPCNICK